MNRRITAWISIVMALTCAAIGWVALGALELGANDSLSEVNAALVSVEDSLRGSTEVASATADALDAAAVSVDDAAAGSRATSDVAREVADVSGTLPPVLESVAEGIDQVNGTVVQLNALLDSLPFTLGDGGQLQTFDPILTDVDPLLEDLRGAEASLDALVVQADAIESSSTELSDELRSVATELRNSVADITVLADDVADARSTLVVSDEQSSVDLLVAQLVIVGLAAAIIIGALPDVYGGRRDRRDEE
ncbi:MAG: hypothetical protein R2733_07565 [Acidimicrobiales bacterium]